MPSGSIDVCNGEWKQSLCSNLSYLFHGPGIPEGESYQERPRSRGHSAAFSISSITRSPASCSADSHHIIFPTLPSAAAVLMEVLPVALYIPCQIHLQVGFGFLNPIPAWSVSLHSSWVSCPLPCASSYYLIFFFLKKKSSLIIHAIIHAEVP